MDRCHSRTIGLLWNSLIKPWSTHQGQIVLSYKIAGMELVISKPQRKTSFSEWKRMEEETLIYRLSEIDN